jgi:hypothetical protein
MTLATIDDAPWVRRAKAAEDALSERALRALRYHADAERDGQTLNTSDLRGLINAEPAVVRGRLIGAGLLEALPREGKGARLFRVTAAGWARLGESPPVHGTRGPAPRRCLGPCGQTFASIGAHNRLCPRCADIASRVG